jgi:Ca-activated chloride channel family protein
MLLKKTAFLALLACATLAGCAPRTATTHIAAEPPVNPAPPGVDQPRPVPRPAPKPPELRAEDLVEVEAITSNRYLLADKPGEIAVRVHLKARPRKTDERPPINLGLVVDTSGSMEGAAIEDARAASLALLDSLSEGDRLALVVFHSTTEVLVPSTVLTKKNIPDIRAKISAMTARGTTDLAGGLSAGLAEVQRSFQAAGINRIVLLGDGVPNDPSQLPGLAQSAGAQHISITALGLGLDYDETLMSQLSLASGGKYHFVRESSQVAKVFSDEVLRLKKVVGRGAMVTFTPGPGVVVKDVLGLPVQRSGSQATVVLGDLSEGDERDILVRLSVPGRHAGSVVELLDATVGMDHPDLAGSPLSERAFVSVKSTADAAEIEQGRQKDVQHAVARLGVADAIVRAVAAARAGDLRLARSILDAAEKEAKAAAKEYGDADLAEKAKSIGPLRKSLPQLAPPPPPKAVAVALGPGRPGGIAPQIDMPAPAAAPAPVSVPPATAAIVMKTQAAAMRDIQGN